MSNFLDYGNWFDEKYRLKIGEGVRYFSSKIALNLLLQRGGVNIVETGTTRALDDFGGAGMSTIFFGDFAKTYSKHLWTVDILPEAIELCMGVTKEYASNISYEIGDSLVFLKTFPEKIDLLYLDSMDCPTDFADMPTLLKSQEHQLHEVETAWDKLTDNSIILLDDCGFENGGKGKFARDFIRGKGWTELLCDYQSLWVK